MAKNPDPLEQLTHTHSEALTPAWRALIGLLRFWLGLVGFFAPLGVIVASLALMVAAYDRFRGAGLLAYFALALPATAAISVGLFRVREALATRIARAIRMRLLAVGGSSTPVGFALQLPEQKDDR